MKSYCVRDNITGEVFKIILTKQELEDYLDKNPEIVECVNCVECDDAPSITLE
jgi:ApbE superfamily uncharacterized protein (UPF0280 family)